MNRITRLMASGCDRKLLVPFFTAGYPSLTASIDLVRAAVDSGADMVEIGMPFSDPLADGPQIQHSSQVALKNKTTLLGIMKMVERLRRAIDVPMILMGYYNPLLTYGESKFLADASACGVDGLIIPDLPVSEASTFRRVSTTHDISNIFLVSPTSSTDRIKLIDKACSDFVYAVTVTGVTGAKTRFGSDTDLYLKKLRRMLSKPFVAGFGVSSPESAKRLTRHADGVVIGSALIGILRKAKSVTEGRARVEQFLKRIRKAL